VDFDVCHLADPTIEIVRLAQMAAGGFMAPASLRDLRRDADKHLREMEEWVQLVLDSPSGLAVPPSDANLFIPAPNRNWIQAGAETWQLALRRTILAYVATCREMVQRCGELSPTCPPATTDEETMRKHNEAALRALEEHQSYNTRLNDLGGVLANFQQQIYSSPRPERRTAEARQPDRHGNEQPVSHNVPTGQEPRGGSRTSSVPQSAANHAPAQAGGSEDFADNPTNDDPGAGLAWSDYKAVQEWATLFDVSRNKMHKMLAAQEYRNERLNRQSYRIAIEDLPPNVRRRVVPE
jgi:hypothetical protein